MAPADPGSGARPEHDEHDDHSREEPPTTPAAAGGGPPSATAVFDDALATAAGGVRAAYEIGLLWADEIGRDIEHRLGLDAGDELAWSDQRYGRALALCSRLAELAAALQALHDDTRKLTRTGPP
ncbi:hypothetical protein DP939_11675 [Spongiactinospora rosea]|uniref:Uncharacterized protein n=1 Tax=Spongiactinospora rosea TaxID=2248750 RepID=A0A366M3Q0_9ACTN|nr:hypothetical protein [Spongiactinospora rosea]RBQ20433.1 hypothetical protein DP939_11675 [Spongiactinospora rosea]